MAVRKKNIKSQPETTIPEIAITQDLRSRIEKISEQTGLNTPALFQKWVLQEESLIGLIQRSRNETTEQAPNQPAVVTQQVSDVQKQEEFEEINPDDPNYRKILIKRVKKLKKEGITLVKIAEIFNEENVQTVSGKGKWYSSSITNLLKSNA
jgi:hypothetical protein